MRVLLVDDDYAVSQSIETMLKKEGMIVDTTDLGEDGLEIGKLYDYDIIILDLMLPDMNGYEVLKNLRSAKINTPVLILSGLTKPDKKVKGLGYGADDYLPNRLTNRNSWPESRPLSDAPKATPTPSSAPATLKSTLILRLLPSAPKRCTSPARNTALWNFCPCAKAQP